MLVGSDGTKKSVSKRYVLIPFTAERQKIR